MRHKCQLAHLAGGKCGCEGCCDFICCGADCVGEGEALGVGGASALGGATVVVELDGEGFTAAHGCLVGCVVVGFVGYQCNDSLCEIS